MAALPTPPRSGSSVRTNSPAKPEKIEGDAVASLSFSRDSRLRLRCESKDKQAYFTLDFEPNKLREWLGLDPSAPISIGNLRCVLRQIEEKLTSLNKNSGQAPYFTKSKNGLFAMSTGFESLLLIARSADGDGTFEFTRGVGLQTVTLVQSLLTAGKKNEEAYKNMRMPRRSAEHVAAQPDKSTKKPPQDSKTPSGDPAKKKNLSFFAGFWSTTKRRVATGAIIIASVLGFAVSTLRSPRPDKGQPPLPLAGALSNSTTPIYKAAPVAVQPVKREPVPHVQVHFEAENLLKSGSTPLITPPLPVASIDFPELSFTEVQGSLSGIRFPRQVEDPFTGVPIVDVLETRPVSVTEESPAESKTKRIAKKTSLPKRENSRLERAIRRLQGRADERQAATEEKIFLTVTDRPGFSKDEIILNNARGEEIAAKRPRNKWLGIFPRGSKVTVKDAESGNLFDQALELIGEKKVFRRQGIANPASLFSLK